MSVIQEVFILAELASIRSLPARGRSARYAREFSFARCGNTAGDTLQHNCPAGNTSRTGRLTFPAAQSAKLKVVEKFRRLELKS